MPKWNVYAKQLMSQISNRRRHKAVEMLAGVVGLGSNDIVLDVGSKEGS